MYNKYLQQCENIQKSAQNDSESDIDFKSGRLMELDAEVSMVVEKYGG